MRENWFRIVPCVSKKNIKFLIHKALKYSLHRSSAGKKKEKERKEEEARVQLLLANQETWEMDIHEFGTYHYH